jgi:hypothetical protein
MKYVDAPKSKRALVETSRFNNWIFIRIIKHGAQSEGKVEPFGGDLGLVVFSQMVPTLIRCICFLSLPYLLSCYVP